MLSVHQRHGRTDGQTDGRTTYDSNTARAVRASRGKNEDSWRTCSSILKLSVKWTPSNLTDETRSIPNSGGTTLPRSILELRCSQPDRYYQYRYSLQAIAHAQWPICCETSFSFSVKILHYLTLLKINYLFSVGLLVANISMRSPSFYNKKAVLSQGNRAMPQLFFSV